MRLEFYENDWYGEISLHPETPEETAQLARLALNAKSKPVDIYLSFNDKPRLEISIEKIKASVQQNSISPKNRK